MGREDTATIVGHADVRPGRRRTRRTHSMFQRILIVCVGNICRSPMAEALLKHQLKEAGRNGVVVESAGIAALVGKPADEMAQALMRERGIDLSAHRARQLDSTLVRSFDLILVMERGHQRQIEASFPSARGKVFRIGHWKNFDVPDPYRQPREAFERSLALIESGLAGVQNLLVGRRSS